MIVTIELWTVHRAWLGDQVMQWAIVHNRSPLMHFETRDEAEQQARHFGWRVAEDPPHGSVIDEVASMTPEQWEAASARLTRSHKVLLIPDEMTGEHNPSGFRVASDDDRIWHAQNCWNCRKPRASCECIFP